MTKCAVLFCKNYSDRAVNISFHLFPTDPARKREWVKAVRREEAWIPRKHNTICSIHFEPECFNKESKKQRKLFKHAVPTLHLPKFSHEIKNESIISISENMEIAKNEGVDYKPSTPVNLPETLDDETELKDSPRIRLLNRKIKEQNRKIKRLQYQNRCLKKKVAGLQEINKQLNK